MAWIRILELPGYLYKHKILAEIGEMVRKVVKMDLNTDSRVRGRFARMAVYINLEKPLVSQILVNGSPQRVEYESLLTICFHCGRYGHVKENCPFRNSETTMAKEVDSSEKSSRNHDGIEDEQEKEGGNYGPWMLVDRRSRRKNRENK
ncbi:GroES-like zinc-binding alcohol dehydrogenase family protein [Gossypium australe]|uniref:GroES-like zinc-binding alcohol dehydrogenase family protein n=1 Tax=Gossypium australe TaxID=47621 RepID=A0A5B6V7B1_9ROSI|nr:GroES-like zinc-binding alcohol dehydrogenase family protein [Gossypium australe]